MDHALVEESVFQSATPDTPIGSGPRSYRRPQIIHVCADLAHRGFECVNRPGFTRHAFLAHKFRRSWVVMNVERYTEEFRIEAINQVTDWGHPVAEVASRLGVISHSLYQWIRRYRVPEGDCHAADDQVAGLGRLKDDLSQVTEEHDKKMGAAYFTKASEAGTRLLKNSMLTTLRTDRARRWRFIQVVVNLGYVIPTRQAA
jgi:transposase